MSLRNTGKAPHDAQIIRVEGDQTVGQVFKAIDASGEGKPLPDMAARGRGRGHRRARQVRHGHGPAPARQALRPRHQPQPQRRHGGVPGDRRGGWRGVPGAPVTISAKEYGFVAEGLKAGTAQVTFDNVGKEPHHVIAVPYAKGATLAEVRKALSDQGEPSGAADL